MPPSIGTGFCHEFESEDDIENDDVVISPKKDKLTLIRKKS
jgi:hypothetical protein